MQDYKLAKDEVFALVARMPVVRNLVTDPGSLNRKDKALPHAMSSLNSASSRLQHRDWASELERPRRVCSSLA